MAVGISFWLPLALSALLFVAVQCRKTGRRPPGYPPGPPTLPVLGNLHQLPKTNGHLQFQKWAREYGPVYSLMLGPKVMIVLSSDQAVKDLLDKRGGIYSSRPERYIAQDCISQGHRVVLMGYDELLRTIRKVARRVLDTGVIDTYIPYQDLESKAMLKSLLDTPAAYYDHIRRYTTSLTTSMDYGFRLVSMEDPRAKQLFDGFLKFNALAGSQIAILLDIFVFLRKLPDVILPTRRRAAQVGRDEHELFMAEYLDVKRKTADGTAIPCFAADLVHEQRAQDLTDKTAAYICGSFLQAGSETTSAEIIAFVQAMLIFQNVPKLAQAELDRVCGDRLPELSDAPELPYVRGCIKETLRWMPTAILGVPHAVSRTDTYMGYIIPQDAAVVLNVWAIQNDPQRHRDPRTFDPDRWRGEDLSSADSATHPDVRKRDHFVYGAGRRLCQGMHIADRSLFLAIARMLWAFDFQRDTNQITGDAIIPDAGDLTQGLFVYPRSFPCRLVPRDASKAACINGSWDKALELLDEHLQWKGYPEALATMSHRVSKR
ncbi:cytochrome P450 [Hypoxylon argillaceum]|nr:cytochrome P450 [Hypoxylon argillaceum]